MPRTKHPKRTTQRRKGAIKSAIRKAIGHYVGPVRSFKLPLHHHHTNQLFPQVWRNRICRSYIAESMIAAAGFIKTFKGNSFFQAGPRTNNAGAFSTNVPAGLYYLMSSNSTSGAVAPYNQCRIVGSRCTVNITSIGTNTRPAKIALFPSTNVSSSGLAFNSQFPEQQWAVWVDIPQSTNAKPIRLTNQMSTYKIFGIPETQLESTDYLGTSIADPTSTAGASDRTWYWQIYMLTDDGATAGSYQVDIELDYMVDLLSKNNYVSTVPS